jgi:hypothetical protein
MCFGSLKGDDPSARLNGTTNHQDLNARPASIRSSKGTTSKMPQSSVPDYAPPSGPPPSHQQEAPAYDAPSGPPPAKKQHDWESAVPDTSLLPPPPSMGYERSKNNAAEDDAVRGENFCKDNPLSPPQALSSQALEAIDTGNIALQRPPEFAGELKQSSSGVWRAKVRKGRDSSLLSALPLYVVDAHHPAHTKRSKTVYYEVKILSKAPEVTLALGYVARPYPSFRLPGWERASLGVHGDDGRKFVNDKWGGKDFVEPFKSGDVLGIGMIFSPGAGTQGYVDVTAQPGSGGVAAAAEVKTEIFFTRNGDRVGGWDLHEESDAQEDLSVWGLEGSHDLFAAIGSFDSVEFDVLFDQRKWAYSP